MISAQTPCNWRVVVGMSATQPAISIRQETSESEDLTLLELVQAVCEATRDDREVVATVCDMLRSGRVRLSGNFRAQPELILR